MTLLICTLSIREVQILLILGAKISIFRNYRLRAAVPMLLLHEQLGCETRRAGEVVGEVRGGGPLPHPTVSPPSSGARLG